MVAGCLFCQPVAILSSLAYMAVTFILYRQHKHKTAEFMGWGGLMVLVGLCSMIAHANYTRIGMGLDFASITYQFTFFMFYRVMNMGRLKNVSSYIKYPVYFIVLLGIYLPLDNWSQFYVCIGFFTLAAIDFIKQKNISVLLEKSLIICFSVLALSTLMMLFDRHESFCSIKFLPYGHTLWHFGSALSAYFFGKWYFLEQRRPAV